MWRYLLIAGYVVLGIGGLGLAMFTSFRALGYGLVVTGFVCIGINSLLNARDARVEEEARAQWIASIQALADDLALNGYGIPTLPELATYHDAAGRAAVLAALRSLPEGRRSLLAAARLVDPEAEWD